MTFVLRTLRQVIAGEERWQSEVMYAAQYYS